VPAFRARDLIDPQLGESPAAPLIKVIDEEPVAKIGDKMLIMADVGCGVFTASSRIRPPRSTVSASNRGGRNGRFAPEPALPARSTFDPHETWVTHFPLLA